MVVEMDNPIEVESFAPPILNLMRLLHNDLDQSPEGQISWLKEVGFFLRDIQHLSSSFTAENVSYQYKEAACKYLNSKLGELAAEKAFLVDDYKLKLADSTLVEKPAHPLEQLIIRLYQDAPPLLTADISTGNQPGNLTAEAEVGPDKSPRILGNFSKGVVNALASATTAVSSPPQVLPVTTTESIDVQQIQQLQLWVDENKQVLTTGIHLEQEYDDAQRHEIRGRLGIELGAGNFEVYFEAADVPQSERIDQIVDDIILNRSTSQSSQIMAEYVYADLTSISLVDELLISLGFELDGLSDADRFIIASEISNRLVREIYPAEIVAGYASYPVVYLSRDAVITAEGTVYLETIAPGVITASIERIEDLCGVGTGGCYRWAGSTISTPKIGTNIHESAHKFDKVQYHMEMVAEIVRLYVISEYFGISGNESEGGYSPGADLAGAITSVIDDGLATRVLGARSVEDVNAYTTILAQRILPKYPGLLEWHSTLISGNFVLPDFTSAVNDPELGTLVFMDFADAVHKSFRRRGGEFIPPDDIKSSFDALIARYTTNPTEQITDLESAMEFLGTGSLRTTNFSVDLGISYGRRTETEEISVAFNEIAEVVRDTIILGEREKSFIVRALADSYGILLPAEPTADQINAITLWGIESSLNFQGRSTSFIDFEAIFEQVGLPYLKKDLSNAEDWLVQLNDWSLKSENGGVEVSFAGGGSFVLWDRQDYVFELDAVLLPMEGLNSESINFYATLMRANRQANADFAELLASFDTTFEIIKYDAAQINVLNAASVEYARWDVLFEQDDNLWGLVFNGANPAQLINIKAALVLSALPNFLKGLDITKFGEITIGLDGGGTVTVNQILNIIGRQPLPVDNGVSDLLIHTAAVNTDPDYNTMLLTSVIPPASSFLQFLNADGLRVVFDEFRPLINDVLQKGITEGQTIEQIGAELEKLLADNIINFAVNTGN